MFSKRDGLSVKALGLVALVLMVGLAPAIAQEEEESKYFVRTTDPSITGESGFIKMFSADSLPQGQWALALWYHNWDRETSDLDVNDVALSFAYGLTDRLELAGTVYVWRQTDTDFFNVVDIDDTAFGVDFRHPAMPFPVGPINEGFGDIRLGAKYTFVEETRSTPGIALAGHVKFGTADEEEGLGSGEIDYGVDLALTKRFNKALQLGGQVGYIFRSTPDVLDDLGIDLGGELTYGIAGRLFFDDDQIFRLIGELQGGSLNGTDNLDPLEDSLQGRIGLEVRLKNGWRLSGGYTRELMFDDPSDDKNGAFFTLSYSTDRAYEISGTVTDCTGAPMDGVRVHFSDIDAVTYTDLNGIYKQEVRVGYSGTVTLEKNGYFFLPEPRSYDKVSEHYPEQDYVGWPEEVEVGGSITDADGNGIADVVVTHSNGQSITTSADGSYSFTVRGRSEGTITAANECYEITFAGPDNSTSSSPSDGDSGVASYNAICEPLVFNFTGELKMFDVSGTVTDSEGNALGGVTLDYGDGTVTTSGDGSYSFTMPCGWEGNVKPGFNGFVFDPAGIDVGPLEDDMTGVDFVGFRLIVFFEFDQYNIFREDVADVSLKTLKQLVHYMTQVDTEAKVAVHGHTCYIQLRCHNNALSKARALFISQWLIEQGVDPSRITYRFYGEDRPAYDNSNEMTRRNNRRVEVEFIDSIGSPQNLTEKIRYEDWKKECDKK